MPRHSYRERDYAFGQAMLTLRSSIGLTQAGLAELLGVSRRAATCAVWTSHGSPFVGPICKGSRCKMRIFPEP